MLVGRILNYSYVVSRTLTPVSDFKLTTKGMEMSVVGNFQAELVPREVRGFAVGSYQLAIVGPAL